MTLFWGRVECEAAVGSNVRSVPFEITTINHHNKSDFVPIELGIPEKSILVAVGYLSKHPIPIVKHQDPIVKPMEDTSSFCLSDHHTF